VFLWFPSYQPKEYLIRASSALKIWLFLFLEILKSTQKIHLWTRSNISDGPAQLTFSNLFSSWSSGVKITSYPLLKFSKITLHQFYLFDIRESIAIWLPMPRFSYIFLHAKRKNNKLKCTVINNLHYCVYATA